MTESNQPSQDRRRIERLLRDPAGQDWIEPGSGLADRIVASLAAAEQEPVPGPRRRWLVAAALVAVVVSLFLVFARPGAPAPPPADPLVGIIERLPHDLAAMVPEQELLREWEAITTDAAAVAQRLAACLPR